jgi:hypothetical protein
MGNATYHFPCKKKTPLELGISVSTYDTNHSTVSKLQRNQKNVKIAKYNKVESVSVEQLCQEQANHLPVLLLKTFCYVLKYVSKSQNKVKLEMLFDGENNHLMWNLYRIISY